MQENFLPNEMQQEIKNSILEDIVVKGELNGPRTLFQTHFERQHGAEMHRAIGDLNQFLSELIQRLGPEDSQNHEIVQYLREHLSENDAQHRNVHGRSGP